MPVQSFSARPLPRWPAPASRSPSSEPAERRSSRGSCNWTAGGDRPPGPAPAADLPGGHGPASAPRRGTPTGRRWPSWLIGYVLGDRIMAGSDQRAMPASIVPMAEAIVALLLADHMLRQKAAGLDLGLIFLKSWIISLNISPSKE